MVMQDLQSFLSLFAREERINFVIVARRRKKCGKTPESLGAEEKAAPQGV